MARVVTHDDALPFVAQPSSLLFDMGRDIDWDETGSATLIAAGTPMSLLASGAMCPRLTRPGTEVAYGILVASADKNDKTGLPGHGLIIGGVLFENLTPEFADAAWATIKTEIGAAVIWLTYADDRVV